MELPLVPRGSHLLVSVRPTLRDAEVASPGTVRRAVATSQSGSGEPRLPAHGLAATTRFGTSAR